MSGILDPNELEERSKIVHQHIVRLLECTEIMRSIDGTLRALRETQSHQLLMEIKKLREEHEFLREQLTQAGICTVSMPERQFTALRDMMASEDWPSAVREERIPRTDEQWDQRAQTIMMLHVGEHLDGLKFLDIGCGTGWTVDVASKQGAMAVGYDISNLWKFQCNDKMYFTTNRREVAERGPYDVILLYDVLDHVEGDPVEVLKFAASMLGPRGRLYVRNHPWCGRHGGHVYEKFNRAFAHVVMDEVELMRAFGVEAPPVNRLTKPIETYRKWFEAASLDVISETPVQADVEPFFARSDNHIVNERISRHWPGEDPSPYLSLQFVDYQLRGRDLNNHVL